LLAAGCGGGGGSSTTSSGTIVVRDNAGGIASAATSVRYSGYDANGNLTYSSQQSVSALRNLAGVPTSTTTLVSEFYSSTEEELSHVASATSFTDGVSSIVVGRSSTLFLKRRVAIVDMDAATGSILVRGNLPLVTTCVPGQDRCFAYSDLNARIKELLPAFTSLDDYDVIEFVLHDDAGNRDELDVEMKALGLGVDQIQCGAKWLPFQGCDEWDPKTLYASVKQEKKPWGLSWWPMYACGSVPCDNTREVLPGYTEEKVALEKFHFIEASRYLRQLLTTPAARKRLIYFHCIQGADRTGSLHMMYMLDGNPTLSFAEACDRAWKGKREGSDEAQLDYLHDDVKPMCRYVGLAYRYCQETSGNNPGRCDLPDSWESTTACKH
jgi:hypothetical protein